MGSKQARPARYASVDSDSMDNFPYPNTIMIVVVIGIDTERTAVTKISVADKTGNTFDIWTPTLPLITLPTIILIAPS